MSKGKFKVRVESEKQSSKSVKSDGFQTKGDRVIFNLSYQVMDGAWVAFGYESNVTEGESLSEAKERVWDEVVNTVTAKSEELLEAYGGDN